MQRNWGNNLSNPKDKGQQQSATEPPINYDTNERAEGVRNIYGDEKLAPNINGEYIITYSYEISDYNIAESGQTRMSTNIENNNTGKFDNVLKYQNNAFQQISNIANITFRNIEDYNREDVTVDLVIAATKDNFLFFYEDGELLKDPTSGTSSLPKNEFTEFILYNNKYFESSYNEETNNKDDSFQYYLALHESGHKLGLNHTHNGPYKMAIRDPNNHTSHSQMSYKKYENGYSPTYSPWDIAAIQDKYGANHEFNAGDDTYKITGKIDNPRTIWDGAGIDTLDASDSWHKAELNLWESIITPSIVGDEEVFLAYGANIENAIGTVYDDKITGNSLDNVLNGNKGDDILRGDGGSDIYIGGGGDDIFDLRRLNSELFSQNKNEREPSEVKDFELGSVWALADSEDRINVSADVEKIEIIKMSDSKYRINFRDKNGVPSANTNDVIINLDKDNHHSDITDIDIYKVSKNGEEVKFNIDEDMITDVSTTKIQGDLKDETEEIKNQNTPNLRVFNIFKS